MPNRLMTLCQIYDEVVADEHSRLMADIESMKLFERVDGESSKVFHFGWWRRWKKAKTKEEADKLVAEFNAAWPEVSER